MQRYGTDLYESRLCLGEDTVAVRDILTRTTTYKVVVKRQIQECQFPRVFLGLPVSSQISRSHNVPHSHAHQGPT